MGTLITMCVSYGIGNFSLLAAKISGSNGTIRNSDFTCDDTSGIQESNALRLLIEETTVVSTAVI